MKTEKPLMHSDMLGVKSHYFLVSTKMSVAPQVSNSNKCLVRFVLFSYYLIRYLFPVWRSLLMACMAACV